ncbi:diguanylate cyclase [Bacillus sp. B15-48]|uniref:diguanylate cyclase n=1 Tax=Bacillus sp. B15-48 TaxID=1548601 RepID=UPI00193FF458|nr:diguanylate cyclase [Bacillus sp. B15-48]MBM4760915.1 diguanylate cyclase [Bacillus sp. B15-48]
MSTLKNQIKFYISSISLFGIVLFLLSINLESFSHPLWVMIFALSGTVVLLNYNHIQLPPKGNTLSMDSSVFLASLFLFGVNVTLFVLFLNTAILTFSQRSSIWWKHVLNFSIYSFMIILSYHVFILTGGEVGNVHLTDLIPYISSLSVYFIVNAVLVGVYFLLAESENLITVLKGMVGDTLTTYASTLLLSLVLVILISSHNLFGLFLFVCVSILLSQAFKKHFELYKGVAAKASKDFLTGLNNHGYFKELLDQELVKARESEQALNVAILDIDDFKKYNDLHGHIQGDQLLKEFGALLKEETEQNDFIVARYGGEEFSIIMPKTSQTEALAFINRLRKKTNDTHFEGVKVLPYGCLSFSAGIAELDKETYSTSELLNKADIALYSVKEQGKNMVRVYNKDVDYSTQKTVHLEKELAAAEQQLKLFLSKDVHTYRHSKRVFQYAIDFSKVLKLNESERKTLILGALVHDIGKIEIPRELLNKTSELEPHEWELMKKHVTWGKEIISINKQLENVIPLVELHHERYDGNGYPYGIEGESIPKLARILSIIDSFDAMTTERPYQKTKSFQEAFVELRDCAGTQFDASFVEPFIHMIEMNYGLNGNQVEFTNETS